MNITEILANESAIRAAVSATLAPVQVLPRFLYVFSDDDMRKIAEVSLWYGDGKLPKAVYHPRSRMAVVGTHYFADPVEIAVVTAHELFHDLQFGLPWEPDVEVDFFTEDRCSDYRAVTDGYYLLQKRTPGQRPVMQVAADLFAVQVIETALGELPLSQELREMADDFWRRLQEKAAG